MAIPTISDVISRGDISIYLSANDNAKGAVFGGRRASPRSPVTIAMVTDALRWGYNAGNSAQTDESLREVANYLIWLTGMYGQQAEQILNGAGGGTVIPSGGGAGAIPKYFIVDNSSYMVNGDSLKTISDFIGFNLVFTRNGIPQSTVTTEPTYFTWDKVAGLFTCVPAVVTDELIGLIPV